MKIKKRIILILLFLNIFIPFDVLAYSNFVIPGGENIGIKVNNRYITIQGFYKVNNVYIAEDAGLKVGDYITKVNGKIIKNIDEMINEINNSNDNIVISFLRNNQENNVTLPIIKDNGIIKTGIYVKNGISGIGTLTYVDPSTMIFGALGHEIIDKNTLLKIEIKDGTIFKSDVINIDKSENGNPGQKNARFYYDEEYGSIDKNESEGIFGTYNNIDKFDQLIEIDKLENINIGKAYIRTVIDNNKKEDFEINILSIDTNNKTKNILFEITDKNLLDKTNGVIAGMSGSPIIQNNKLVGAVTHVVVNEPHKGYGIAIENMLRKGEE